MIIYYSTDEWKYVYIRPTVSFTAAGLTWCVSSQIAQKYDTQKEEDLRFWIEERTQMPIGENFTKGLKDGVILCK